MKTHMALISGLTFSAVLLACSNSSSSDDTPAPATESVSTGSDAVVQGSTTDNTPSAQGQTGVTNNPAPVDAGSTGSTPTVPAPTGENQAAIALSSTFLEYSRFQYDCGDITAPLDAASVESKFKGVKSFETLAATIPAKDQALVKIAVEDNGVACTYRALFSVNKSFTEVTFFESQALNSGSVTDCGSSKSQIDLGFGTDPIRFEYDKKFIRWVALHIPVALQTAPLCPNGNLRAVFAGVTI